VLDRTKSQKDQHKTAMRVVRDTAVELLPQGSRSKRDEFGIDEGTGLGIHRDAVLRNPSDDGGSSCAWLLGKPQENSAVASPYGTKCDISEAPFEQKRFGAQDIPIFVEGLEDRTTKPSMVNGHNVYTIATRVRVSGSCYGLVQPLCVVLGVVGNNGDGVLCIGAGMGIETRQP